MQARNLIAATFVVLALAGCGSSSHAAAPPSTTSPGRAAPAVARVQARIRALRNFTAQSELRNALTAAKTIYTDTQDYAAATPAALAGVEPSLRYAALAGARVHVIGVRAQHGEVLMVTKSGSGTWFCIRDRVDGAGTGTFYGTGTSIFAVDDASKCVATSSWQRNSNA